MYKYLIELWLLLTCAEQHYIPEEITPCDLAKFCNHTYVEECGIDNKTLNKRIFLDECDMFEYNCDHQTAYIITNLEDCESLRTTTTISTSTTPSGCPTCPTQPVCLCICCSSSSTAATTANNTEASTSTENPSTSNTTECTRTTLPTTAKSTEMTSPTTLTTVTTLTTTTNPATTISPNTIFSEDTTTTMYEFKNTETQPQPTDISTTMTTSTKTTTTAAASIKNIMCYPKDCARPQTWETTSIGETRDFFQILKQRFGRRARLMQATTNWPRRSLIPPYDVRGDAFLFGPHSDT